MFLVFNAKFHILGFMNLPGTSMSKAKKWPKSTITWNRCKAVSKFALLTNKPHASVRLVSKSVTLNDLERRNAVILRYYNCNASHLKVNWVNLLYSYRTILSATNVVQWIEFSAIFDLCRYSQRLPRKSALTRGTPLSNSIIWVTLGDYWTTVLGAG